MGDFKLDSELGENNLIFIADNLQSEIHKLKFNRISDSLLTKHLDFYANEIDKIKDLIGINPRFKWQLLEKEIDCNYIKDKSLTGASIFFDWKHNVAPNRVFLNFKL
ncbi:hypothetical protein [uncultured Tenacibaculum sp.]|uniref:hypothetical protein n=1 Tax=uncultured Tenacibaculum sp. TaxID=174713 RepID=UPI00262541A8|nr:hypothetical protein [uncultured Tenacibaculum sp.]